MLPFVQGPARTSGGPTSWALVLALVAVAPPVLAQPDDSAVVETDAGAAPSAETDAQAAGPLRVVVAGSPPFVQLDDQGKLEGGLAIDVWRALGEHDPRIRDAQLQPVAGVAAGLEAVREGRADVALGPITINAERAQHVLFSQPYHRAALSILAPGSQSLWSRFAPFATAAFGAGLAVLFVVLAGVGTLLWMVERRANPEQFPSKPVPGIANGIWLALVTMTTVGYGDLSPITKLGRLVAGVWMVIAMLTASSLTASIATALTLSQLEAPGISNASDLRDRKVATVAGSPAAGFAERSGARLVEVDDYLAGIEAVETGRAEALVWDRDVLAYHLHGHPDTPLTLSSSEYERRGYGIATALSDTQLMQAVDVALLRVTESGAIDALQERWLEP